MKREEIDKIINYIKAQHLVLATAESCTAGAIMETLASHGECGDCLFIGYVVYSALAKKKQLKKLLSNNLLLLAKK